MAGFVLLFFFFFSNKVAKKSGEAVEIGGKVSKSDFEGIISPDFPFTVILKIRK